ncbi:hypothetical protein ELH73_07575 [Rhizobium leguminosarum]|uniref:Uncharacterized protein n=1 Tax=Rhizobium leguminosarum TaxID=384 RepID=A0ABD7PPF6_RHILE|nr:hypothetical protein KS05_01350 [Rhizobium brockwellii]TAV73378.1 hypothetical protein ELI28_07565 [Rhizobium leguminosarum]TAV77978.1 hypothetical protein ELI27_07565 [Rhizobium leguminosarum]TAW29357.1 hypothetical protein ELI19_07540 [Rhizobium leguminosarum]TAW43085.1 hypothetical protein ELI18_07480 [Rhizobium leguminosarum]
MITTERHVSIFFDPQNRAWRTTDRCVGSKNVEDSGSPGISVESDLCGAMGGHSGKSTKGCYSAFIDAATNPVEQMET